MLNAAPIDEFGYGVDLRRRPGDLPIGAAVDLRDVWFPEPGAVSSRPGWEQLTADLGVEPSALAAFRTAAGGKYLVAGYTGGELRAFNPDSGAQLAATTAPLGDYWSFARFGSPTQERLWAANGLERFWAWDGSSFSQPTLTGDVGVGTGRYVAMWSSENRMVNACFPGIGGLADDNNPSTIRLGYPLDPTRWESLEFVQMTPGDGEPIMGVASYREFVFIFKPSRILVFYGSSIDPSTATPKFHFDVVEAGVGCSFRGACVTARDGVYFVHRTGVYKIRGVQDPERVSGPIDPLFTGELSYYFQINGGQRANIHALDAVRLYCDDDRLVMSYASGSAVYADTQAVYDLRLGAWTLWNAPVRQWARIDDISYLAMAGGQNRIGFSDGEQPDDNGAPIDSWWQGAYQQLSGDPGTRVLRQTAVTGGGMFSVETGVDYRPCVDPRLVDASGGLGTSVVRNDTLRGLRHSIRFSSVGGQPWQVHRAMHYYEQPSHRPVELSVFTEEFHAWDYDRLDGGSYAHYSDLPPYFASYRALRAGPA